MSRPSRSQVTVRVGSFANGSPKTQTYHWNSCKIAHMREDAKEAERPRVGRKPNPKPTSEERPVASNSQNTLSNKQAASSNTNKNGVAAKIQTSVEPVEPTLSGNAPHPDYVEKGPVITQKMYDDCNWSEIFNNSRYPKRSTRNRNPIHD